MYVTQSIHRPHGINVFGSCLIRVEPDYASPRFTVANAAERPEEALAATHAAADRVLQVLTQGHVAGRDIRCSRVAVEMAYEGYGDKRRWIGYRANLGYQVFVRDLTRVEALLVELVEAGAKEIQSVSYKTPCSCSPASRSGVGSPTTGRCGTRGRTPPSSRTPAAWTGRPRTRS